MGQVAGTGHATTGYLGFAIQKSRRTQGVQTDLPRARLCRLSFQTLLSRENRPQAGQLPLPQRRRNTNKKRRTCRHPGVLMILLRATLALLLLMPLLAVRAESGYGYPLHNPFEATIAGTPTALMPALPADKHIRQKDYSLNLRPQRAERLLGNFWPVKHFKYRLARQAGPAPLIYLIAGTGARYDAQAMEYLKKLFYGAGFHVVQLSSPTSYDFMVGASRHATPGFSPLDAAELYQLMQTIRQRHPRLIITDEHLAGYSLGALQAAFISELDSREQKIGLQRVLMLNPPG